MEGHTIETFAENMNFVLVSLLIMLIVLLMIFFLDRFVRKKIKTPLQEVKRSKKIATIGLLAAVGGVLTIIEIPIPVFSFYQLDLSDVAAMIGGFLMGPMAAGIIEFIKAVLHVLLHGTHSAFVGEFAMFITGCLFTVPAAVIYNMKKTRRNAAIGLGISILVLVLLAGLFNGFYLIPKFAELYTGADLDALVQRAQEQIPAIKSVWTIVAFATVPFNFIKGIVVSLIVFMIYKPLSKLYRKVG